MSDAIYTSCAEVLSVCQSHKDDLSTLLDPETGFAPRLRKICIDHLTDLEVNVNADKATTANELDALKMESDTWALLQALMSLRKTAPPIYPDPRTLLASNPYTPPAILAQSTMHSSPLLSALVVVQEWLHDSAPLPSAYPLGATTGYWRFTRNAVLQGKRTGRPGAGLVSEMDPDAINRDTSEGKGLAPDDASYDRILLQALYAHVRSGRLEDAIDLCRKAHQPWRAASIRGALLFQWRAMSNEARDEETTDAEDVEDEGWRGNVRRRLWKTACTRAALNKSLSPTERALFAALAPSPQTSGPLKALCHTWSDHLWALVRVACEERLSAGLSNLENECFWEGGLGALEEAAARDEHGQVPERDEDEWEKEVLNALGALGGVQVSDGPPASNPYHVSQLHIILDRTDELLDAYANGLKDGSYDRTSAEYPTMTRFFAHLCLFLRMIDMPVSPLATQIILEAYLQVLEAAGQRDLIAMYAGALGDNAVERYAMFLTSLELSADINERRLALIRAREHGLDVNRVATVTAERTIEKAFEMLPPITGSLPSLIELQEPTSHAEWLLVRSIEWTTFSEVTYATALEQANVIIRYLLGCGRVQVAKGLLDILPPELGTIRESQEQAMEYMHYRQFFAVWESLARVVECEALEAPQMNKETRAAWLSDYKSLVDQAREQVTKLLTTDWLVSDVEHRGDDRRRHDLIRIRQIYVPELIIRLHVMLTASRGRIPENLKHSFALVNVVADSRYKLYNDFASQPGDQTRQLGHYLGAVRQTVLIGLEGGGSDPFRVITL
ncbi:hypothetical protein A0H81_06689 [Grifola frondosa]|uniref:Nuclear pore complex protein n=1 Tax=Grifola frondosa TaxID=5627 RepID=A0A1C7M8L7_GRIFR|nr:hypothetical protein A0H81_06689 [Grifola frondosa]